MGIEGTWKASWRRALPGKVLPTPNGLVASWWSPQLASGLGAELDAEDALFAAG
jgi:hypothetical protein